MVTAVLSVAIILGGGSLWITKESMENQIFTAVRTEAHLRANHIENNLANLKALVGVLAKDQSILAGLNSPEALNAVVQRFAEVQTDNSAVMEMMILVDAEGNAIADQSGTDLDINISERAYFQELLSTQGIVVSDVVVSKSSGNPVIVVAAPVLESGSVKGAILSTITFDTLRSVVKEAKIGTDGYGYMADAAGLVLSHKNPDYEMNLNLADVAAENAEFSALFEKMKSDETGEAMYTYKGKRKFVAFEKADKWIVALTADEVDYLSAVYRIVRLTAIIGALIAVLAIAITYIFTRLNIIAPIKRLKHAMALAGTGDFTVKVKAQGRDEIADLTNAYMEMVDNQREMIIDMQKTAEQLNQMAEELNASSQEVAATSEEMTAAIETIAHHTDDQVEMSNDTVASLNELEGGIDTSAALVADALASSKACTEEAANGKAALQVSKEGMHRIDEVTSATVNTLHHLAEQAASVTSISTAIQQIASQINLLALNASIEAARAGEHGRGFSVVADEVRKLAELTTAESAQITESLNGILKTVEEATATVDAMKAQVDEGNKAIDGTQDALERLYYGVESMIALNESVLYANQGERALVGDACGKLESLDGMSRAIAKSTQEIAAGTEEQAAITQSLTQVAEETSALAENVLHKLTRFKL